MLVDLFKTYYVHGITNNSNHQYETIHNKKTNESKLCGNKN